MNQQTIPRIQACLQEASSMVQAHDWVNAYETLASENRKNPDESLERALIDILLQASQSTRSVKRAKPGDVGVLEKGSSETGVIPEVSAAELTSGKLGEAIRDHGYLMVRGIVPDESCATLRSAIDSAFLARHEAAASKAAERSNGPFYYESPHFPGTHISFSAREKDRNFGRTGSIMVADSPRGAFQVLEAFRAMNLRNILTSYFDEPAVIASRKWVFRLVAPRIGLPFGGGWHQDGQFMGAAARALNMWVPLSPCGDSTSAPGLALIPKRIDRILEFGTRSANIKWVVPGEVVAEISEDAPEIKPYFGAGDALFFDHLSLHRTGHAKNQDQHRYALESWFYGASGSAGNAVMPLY
jgi:Phytanoyl-CoA dioxygenase (PhyH)